MYISFYWERFLRKFRGPFLTVGRHLYPTVDLIVNAQGKIVGVVFAEEDDWLETALEPLESEEKEGE